MVVAVLWWFWLGFSWMMWFWLVLDFVDYDFLGVVVVLIWTLRVGVGFGGWLLMVSGVGFVADLVSALALIWF